MGKPYPERFCCITGHRHKTKDHLFRAKWIGLHSQKDPKKFTDNRVCNDHYIEWDKKVTTFFNFRAYDTRSKLENATTKTSKHSECDRV